MAPCGVPTCSRSMSTKAFKISCAECSKLFHGSCVNMTKVDLDAIVEDNLQWRCDPCQRERRRSMRLESASATGNVTLEDIMTELLAIKEEQKETKREFNNSYELLYKKLDNAYKSIEEQRKVTADYLDKIESLEAKNKELAKKNVDLEIRIDELEQYSRKNCVEIQGIPRETEESVVDVVKKVGAAVDFAVTDDMIDNCHRLGSRQDSTSPTIIVKFTRFMDKEKFLAKKRIKKELSTRHMGMQNDSKIFINESLSPARKKLHYLARMAKKQKGYTFLWTRGGRIFMRKNADAASIVFTINHANDLNKL